MDNSIEIVFFKQRVHRFGVGTIKFIENRSLPGNTGNTFQNIGTRIRKVINNYHVVTGLLQLNHGMRTDVAGSSSNKNLLSHNYIFNYTKLHKKIRTKEPSPCYSLFVKELEVRLVFLLFLLQWQLFSIN